MNTHDESLAALTATRAIIAAGWAQNVLQREVDGVMCHCLTAAAMTAESHMRASHWDGKGAFESIARLIILERYDSIGDESDFTDPFQIIVEWNDRPGRTQEEVLALIDRAIAAQVAT